MTKKLLILFLLSCECIFAQQVTPSDCNPCICPCNDMCGFFIGAEGLYWTACQDDLEYAADVGEGGILVGPGENHSLHYPWKTGIRGWWGIHCAGGEGRFVYTWIQNKAHGHKEGDLIATLIHPASPGFEASEARGHNQFEFQTLDMLFGNNLSYCCDAIWIHPYFGARAMKLYQKFNVHYNGIDFENTGIVKAHSLLKAGGITAGFDMLYKFTPCFRIYGGFAGSLLGGRAEAHQRQQSNVNGDIETQIDLEDSKFVCVPGYQARAGLAWRFHCTNYYDFLFTIGYEFSHWFRVPTTQRFVDNVNEGVSESLTRGGLTLHGATVSMLFAF